MVWIDLEMTGLDPAKEKIIEIATIITNKDLEVIAEGPNLVIHQSNWLLKKMDEWNKTTHGKSGLIDAVKASKITTKQAEMETLNFIKEYCEEKKAPICGNSIHHDRLFLRKYMPTLNDYLHYRLVDVSSVKGVIDRWYPNAKRYNKSSDHRALDDIRESIRELKYYQENFFIPLPENGNGSN